MKNMLVSAILWVLMGSAVLWIVLFDVLAISWVFALIKKMIWGKKIKKVKTVDNEPNIESTL